MAQPPLAIPHYRTTSDFLQAGLEPRKYQEGATWIGVYYRLAYQIRRDMSPRLVPFGYSDGIPWHAGNWGFVLFIIGLEGRVASEGDEVVVSAPGDCGEPTVVD
jgi:hypothetical protein